jgi:hypothetical protein
VTEFEYEFGPVTEKTAPARAEPLVEVLLILSAPVLSVFV